MRTTVTHNFSDLSDDDYRALGRARATPLFDRPDWFEALHRQCLPDRQPLIITAENGRARCYLFLMRQAPGRHASLSNWYSFHWRPVFSRAEDEVTRRALLIACAKQAAKHAHRLHFTPVPGEDGMADRIADTFAQAGWIAHASPCDSNHVLHVNGRSFDEYWASRPGVLRSTVKRKGKKGIVSIRIESAFSDESWADYEHVYARSWKPREGHPDFLRDLAWRESEAGCLRLGLAYIDGAPVAAQFWTVEHGEALIHKLAHDDAAKAASPGSLLSAALFQHVIDVDRVRLIDFGTGDDGYKRDWMDGVRPRIQIDLYRPQNPLSWPALAKRNAGQAMRALVARVRNS